MRGISVSTNLLTNVPIEISQLAYPLTVRFGLQIALGICQQYDLLIFLH